ncbi:ubiquitin-specific protease doa4 [Mortierella sp. GBA35]|nr:ubiquitin-specific protease doa4 [Mortierella sp. GBA35]
MLPYTPSTNVLDSPAKKIKSLLQQAKVQLDPDPKFTLRNYVRSAHSILNLADTARVKGDMEAAFVNYLKATTIVAEVIPQVKDFEKHKSDPEYVAIKMRVMELISDTEKIRDLLTAKYESMQDIEAAALAAAAKATRPRPPPRPVKPGFLSSSQHDGQAPIAATSTFANASSSAPATPSVSHLSAVPSSTPPNSSPNQMSSLQGQFNAFSFSSNGSSPIPPPTSLASYRPLQPTIYGSSPQPPSEPFKPQATSIPMIPIPGMTATYSTPAPVPFSAGPIPYTQSSGSVPFSQMSTSPVPAPRPSASLPVPPASAPSAMPSGSVESKPPASTSSQSNESTTSTAATSNGEYRTPLSIKAQRLLDYFQQPNPPALLLLDVRAQVQYKSAKIKTKSIVNIEPVALRDGTSAMVIAERGLFNSPPEERQFFADRANYDLVIYYDQNSQEKEHSPTLCTLFRALHDLEFGRPLKRRPVFLIGGFDAWLETAGMDWVEGHDVDAAKSLHPSPLSSQNSSQSGMYRPGSTPIPSDHHQHQQHAILTKVARGGGISRTEGRAIMANIHDYVNREDGPQSMVNPRNVSSPMNVPNQAYPPRATPHSNINASFPPNHLSYNSASNTLNGDNNTTFGSYPPMQPGNTSISGSLADFNWVPPASTVPSSEMASSKDTRSGQLQRRMTKYDNHWNAFGSSEKHFSPHIPDKIPLFGPNMSTDLAGTNMMSGPSMPAPAPNMSSRPRIPPKPIRPLPQPPGMNDLKDYTRYGSAFSKIAGSQLGKAGLTNLGNTCYMNSVIQCLIATPPLTRFFMDGSFKRSINVENHMGTGGALAEAFSKLIRSMWSGQSLVVSPTGFRNEIGEFAPQFKGSEQHDSQEFLSFLLDGLHEDLKLVPRPTPSGSRDKRSEEEEEARMEALPEIEASEIAWRRYLERDNSIIVDIFQGQYKSRLCCSKCGKTSTTYNAFMYLTLPVKKHVKGQTLTSCLDAFVKSEVIKGDDAWNCPRCKVPRMATKQMTISRVPDVLLIQLKRFSADGWLKDKIEDLVQYPLDNLDLTKYLPKGSSGQGPAEPAIYDLYAVSNHSGKVSSGHYTACVRDNASNGWTNFDDTRVSPCDQSVAVSAQGYTLFYVRRKHEDA